jgi:hypothetical protein
MKFLLAAVLILNGAMAFADSQEFFPAELGLSKACQEKIENETAAFCDKQSLKDEGRDRMHECFEDQYSTNIKKNESNNAVFELVYTAGDADPYTYNVDVKDKARCDFSFGAEQR